MIILGVDPGFQVSGFGILKKENKKIILLESGFLKMNSSKTLSIRVGEFYNHFENLITKWNITDISLETPFLHKNAQNFLKLGYLRGILYLIANKHSLNIHEFSPREIKQSLTGFGGAGKDQVSRIICQLFPGMIVPEKMDVTDAIAVTLCAAWKQNF
jgi:crossover junction endodeoxyribonuclease RuvC